MSTIKQLKRVRSVSNSPTTVDDTLDYLYNRDMGINILCKDIDTFSRAHFSYINQIFGDETVRNIIQEIYKNNKQQLVCIKGTGIFTDTPHHIVTSKKDIKKGIIDSIKQGHQNLDLNINDTLCQSYSLMNYLGKNLEPGNDPKINEARQKAMINMYKMIVNNAEFLKKLEEIFVVGNKNTWPDNTVTVTGNSKPSCIIGNDISKPAEKVADIIRKIKKILFIWEKWGYTYFIGNGKCALPSKKQTTATSRALRKLM